MAVEREDLMVLTKDGVQTLVAEILTAVNNRIQGRIVDEMTEDSDGNHVPSASTVYDAVKNVINIKYLVITDGDIEKASITPEERTLYMVRKSQDAKEAIPYIYINDIGFVAACGVTSITVGDSNIVPMEDDDIKSAVQEAVKSTEPSFNEVPQKEMGTLTIICQSSEKDFVAPSNIVQEIPVGETYNVKVPEVEYFYPSTNYVKGTMVTGGKTEIVVYDKVDAVI